MSRSNGKRGPTREQMTDQQWEHVCGLFDTIERVRKRLAVAKQQVTDALDRSPATSAL